MDPRYLTVNLNDSPVVNQEKEERQGQTAYRLHKLSYNTILAITVHGLHILRIHAREQTRPAKNQ